MTFAGTRVDEFTNRFSQPGRPEDLSSDATGTAPAFSS